MFDNHIHSQYSCDVPADLGGSVSELCLAAVEKGLSGIAITDHYDIDAVRDGYFAPLDHESVLRDCLIAKEEFAGKLKVLYGLELGQPTHMPVEAKEHLKKYPYDIVLASCHAVEGIIDFSCTDIASLPAAERISLWERYLKEMLETIAWGDFDVLTHLTYPKRYYLANGITDYPDIKSKGREYFEPILKAVIDKGFTLECNTSGLRQQMGECLPNRDLLTFYYELGGRDITIGSDAHIVRHVGADFESAAEMLRDIGFKYISRFDKRQKYFDTL